MAKLLIREGPGRGTAYELVDDATKIGRDPNNPVQLPSETVSRTHAVVERKMEGDEEVWTVTDLQSKNGVLLNGQRVPAGRLVGGDEIRLGEVALSFIEREFDTIEITPLNAAEPPLEVRDVSRGETVAQRTPATPDAQRRLGALLDLGQVAASARSFHELFGAVVAAVQKHIAPHRVVPICFDEQKGILKPWVHQRGEFDKALARVPISTSIVQYVQQKRAAILSESAARDKRFAGAASITQHQIASAMCAPIELGDRLLGALYVDRLGEAERFSKADFELLTTMARLLAPALENVRVREEMGRERYVREREARGQFDIVGECEAMKNLFTFITKAAPADAGVLIEGESGTGKELVARAIHLNSRRRHQPFEAVNCAAMAPTLLESELFGHVRGAFTGADRDRPGRFELADGGTLFLDEIGELPDSSQSKLLRVIETGELRRVGDVKDRKVNVRVVAATNKRLAEEVAEKRFREDLYFRLNVLKISLTPLRERQADIHLLAEYFLRQFSEKCGRPAIQFADSVWPVFLGYHWPGNVREMRNAIERMVVMADGNTLEVNDIPYDIRCGDRAGRVDSAAPFTGDILTLRDLEKAHIERVMRHTGGNKKEAARLLGIDRSTLYAKLKLYGLETKEEEPGAEVGKA